MFTGKLAAHLTGGRMHDCPSTGNMKPACRSQAQVMLIGTMLILLAPVNSSGFCWLWHMGSSGYVIVYPTDKQNKGEKRHDKECKITCFCLFWSLRQEIYLNWQNIGHIISSGFCLLRQAWSSRWVIVYLLLMKTNMQEWSRHDWECEMSLCLFISESQTCNILKLFMAHKKNAVLHCVDTLCTSAHLALKKNQNNTGKCIRFL